MESNNIPRPTSSDNSFTALRQNLYMQNSLCRFSVPSLITAKVDASRLMTGERQASVTAYFILAFARAMTKHPHLNASFVRRRFFGSRIVRFDSVDVAVMVDKVFAGERFPFPYVIKNADKKTVGELDKILKYLVHTPAEEIQPFRLLMRFSRLPFFVRRFLLRQMVYHKKILFDKIGSFNFTNVGKWEGLETVFVSAPRLVIGVGRANNNIFSISYSFNHVICDGAQIGEFHQDVIDIFRRMDF